MEHLDNTDFQNYVVESALPLMLENEEWRIFLVNNAIQFIGGEGNMENVHDQYLNHMTYSANDAFGDDIPMNIDELNMTVDSTMSPYTDGENSLSVDGGRRKKSRRRRKQRKISTKKKK